MAFNKTTTKEVKMEIMEDCFSLDSRSNGDTIRCRFISWNGKAPKYDLRVWSTDEDGSERCGKGFTLSGEELEALMKQLIKLSELTVNDLKEIVEG